MDQQVAPMKNNTKRTLCQLKKPNLCNISSLQAKPPPKKTDFLFHLN
jgi:hypothetical protein